MHVVLVHEPVEVLDRCWCWTVDLQVFWINISHSVFWITNWCNYFKFLLIFYGSWIRRETKNVYWEFCQRLKYVFVEVVCSALVFTFYQGYKAAISISIMCCFHREHKPWLRVEGHSVQLQNLTQSTISRV